MPPAALPSALEADPPAPRRTGSRSHGDLVIYAVIAALTVLMWWLSRLGLFKAGDDVGYWIGVAGGVMMLLLFSYPLRKYFRFAHGWGKVKWWFWVHMTLGIGGPMLILLHSTFEVGSINAAVALYSMLIVAGSGVIGRFLFVRVNRGLHGERTSLHELQVRAGFQQSEARSRLHFAPAVEARLLAFEARELQGPAGVLKHLRQAIFLPLQHWVEYHRCVAELRKPLRRLARARGWKAPELRRRDRLARKLVRRYLTSVVIIAQFTAFSRVFALWHVAHVPFVYLLILSAVAHVIAVHAY